jgi:hypothetical protein
VRLAPLPQVYARDGYFLCELGEGRGAGLGQFEGVCGIAITNDAILLASDWKSHRVQVRACACAPSASPPRAWAPRRAPALPQRCFPPPLRV